MTNLRKHRPGCYRETINETQFAQYTKEGRYWKAEIRNTESGEVTRYAGIWNSLKDAREETK